MRFARAVACTAIGFATAVLAGWWSLLLIAGMLLATAVQFSVEWERRREDGTR